jgi:hypothetical protein
MATNIDFFPYFRPSSISHALRVFMKAPTRVPDVFSRKSTPMANRG